ncbi:major facilitator superfamily domain-containing protein [Chaetomium strumarium]|uniref:Major facilitator superfamily domain-containing protein n=1 Tax=Chaetomium strumarium TaxID=1170767 RepID=A0AAJ0M2J6_9PEZI|nr:major facilitator superfamily domain-containing protein [Chaetomium strumarium]
MASDSRYSSTSAGSKQITPSSVRQAESSDAEKLSSSRSQPLPPPGAASEANAPFSPRSVRFWLILLCNFLALFLVALDRTIVATAVPRISDEFKALGDIGWYGSSYMLTTACAQLVFGRIYKFYDVKWTFLLTIVVFEIGSAICGAAPSSAAFIVGRAIAGLGSAGIFSGSMLIMIPMIPLHKRAAFQGIFGMVFGAASVLGPLIGGGFTDGVTWRWCFYINLPIGAVTLAFMVFCWNPPKEKQESVSLSVHLKRLDPLGLVFLLPGVVCLFVAFQWGGSRYKWNEWRIILLFVVFATCTMAFVGIQILRPETAMVPPKVIKQQSIAFGSAYTFFLAGSMLILVYYVPVWFQAVKQVDPMKSGIYTLPLVLSLVVSSIGSGAMIQRIGYYVPSMLIAPSIMCIGEGLLSTLKPGSPTAHWVVYQFLAGFGLGFGMQTAALAAQAVLHKEDVSIGIAINFFVQQLGGAVFTSVGQTILTNLLVSRLSGIPGFNPKTIVSEGMTNLSDVFPPEQVGLVIEAYNNACQKIFLTSMGLAFASLLCAFGMEWRSIKKNKNTAGPPAPPGGPGESPSTQPGSAISIELPIQRPNPKPSPGPMPGKPFFEGAGGEGSESSWSREEQEGGRRSVGRGVLRKPAPGQSNKRPISDGGSTTLPEESKSVMLGAAVREWARYDKKKDRIGRY